ncbi:Protein-tyrosine phosphatase [Plasmodiophora brassicae]|uniref:Uncharacterized protein n=2 Tax=Plasmodiophora brassicae TaxID=37360 RepID=A0A3P3YC69_PLABS|nr:unnamed protein product [Plasmodiophora brassicae]
MSDSLSSLQSETEEVGGLVVPHVALRQFGSSSSAGVPRGLSLSVSMADTDLDLPMGGVSPSDKRFHVPVHDFRRYIAEVLEPVNEICCDGYDEEMDELQRRCVTANLKQLVYPRSSKLTKKNRYMNILPYAHTRVVLDQLKQDADSDYINANFVKADVVGSTTTYISTQAPVPNSVQDFWRMVWEHKSTLVVMLTPLKEKETVKVKSDIYWPKKVDKCKEFSNGISVRMTAEAHTGDIVTRMFEVFATANPNDVRVVHQIQYIAWPDHNVPVSFDSYLAMLDAYRTVRDRSSGPVIVHCSAGVGRTGTFIGIDIAVDHLGHIIRSGTPMDTVCIVDMVYSMRTQRPGMVQTKTQYRFMYEFLGFCIEHGHFGLRVAALTTPSPVRVPIN